MEVPPERLVRWVRSFAGRHGPAVAEAGPAMVVLRAQDGAVAECHPPVPPLRLPEDPGLAGPGPAAATNPDLAEPARLAELMAAHAAAARTVGVLLVRLGGHAAGGWSQHRFARRRENQAAAALRAAADTALAVLGPYAGRLDAVVLGGDRRAMAGVRADPRLASLLAGAEDRFLTVPDPRLAVLTDTPRLFRAIRIRLTGPAN